MENLPIILASSSPRRKDLLKQAGFTFKIHPANIEETILPQWSPQEATIELARQKAAFVKEQIGEQYSCILAADTIVVVENKILGKPKDFDDAFDMLWTLSRQPHSVITGVCLWPYGEKTPLLQADITYMTLEPMSETEIKDYIQSGKAMGRAGAFDIQNTDDKYIQKIDGAFDNVVGLPMKVVKELLEQV